MTISLCGPQHKNCHAARLGASSCHL